MSYQYFGMRTVRNVSHRPMGLCVDVSNLSAWPNMVTHMRVYSQLLLSMCIVVSNDARGGSCAIQMILALLIRHDC